MPQGESELHRSRRPRERLVFDLGGTHLRWALAREGRLDGSRQIAHAGFASPIQALEHALAGLGPEGSDIECVAMAVAGPVFEDSAQLTNRPGWSVEVAALRARFGWRSVHLVNDLVALAWGWEAVRDTVEVWQGGRALAGGPAAPLLFLSVGTGLGAALRLDRLPGSKPLVLATEAGHSDLPLPADSRERAILERMAPASPLLSRERVLSGAGLEALYRVLTEEVRQAGASRGAAEIAGLARSGADPIAASCCQLWSAWLGATAGDLVLLGGAWGGCLLAGGVVNGLGSALDREAFLKAFRLKDRMESHLLKVPVGRIADPLAALKGLSRLLGSEGDRSVAFKECP